MTKLSVNLNKIALLRNARTLAFPVSRKRRETASAPVLMASPFTHVLTNGMPSLQMSMTWQVCLWPPRMLSSTSKEIRSRSS